MFSTTATTTTLRGSAPRLGVRARAQSPPNPNPPPSSDATRTVQQAREEDILGVTAFDRACAAEERQVGTAAVHAGERGGRPRMSDALTVPIVQTSTYTFKNTRELIGYNDGTRYMEQ